MVPQQDPEPRRPARTCRRQTRGDTVWLDLSDCLVDAIEVGRAAGEGIETLPPDRQRALAALFDGDFLEGLAIGRSPVFDGWLTAQRRRFRGRHAALLEHLAKRGPDDEVFPYLEQWLQLAPSIHASTSPPACARAARFAKARSTSRRPPGCSRAKASTRRAPRGLAVTRARAARRRRFGVRSVGTRGRSDAVIIPGSRRASVA